MKDKERLVQAVMSERDMLGRTKEGRASLRLIDLEGYERDSGEWMRQTKRQARALDMLLELDDDLPATLKPQVSQHHSFHHEPLHESLLHIQSPSSDAKHVGPSGGENRDEAAEVDGREGQEGGARKRKRKRTHKGSASEAEHTSTSAPQPSAALAVSNPPVSNKTGPNYDSSNKTSQPPSRLASSNAAVRVNNTSNRPPSRSAHVSSADRMADLKGPKLLSVSQLKFETDKLLREKRSKQA